jgi:hypothetical protein
MSMAAADSMAAATAALAAVSFFMAAADSMVAETAAV